MQFSWFGTRQRVPGGSIRSLTARDRNCRRARLLALEQFEERHLLAISVVGDEVLVNRQTSGTQSSTPGGLAVGSDAVGNFVVAFQGAGPGDSTGVFGQRFDAQGGMPQGEFRANSFTSNSQTQSSLAMSADGRSVIAWSGSGPTDDKGIYFQRYDASGTPQGGQVRANSTRVGTQNNPVVGMADSGEFVIVWAGMGADGQAIYFQRYSATGYPLGGESRANTAVPGAQLLPSLAVAGNGKFVIAWSGQGTNDAKGIFFQQFTANGDRMGSEQRANTTTKGEQIQPAIAMDASGNFTLVWSGRGPQDSSGIFLQRYSDAGVALGGEQLVNTTTSNSQQAPSIAMAPDGSSLVVWQSAKQDGDKQGVYAQQFDASGAKVGGELRVNQTTRNNQRQPSVTVSRNGNYVVVWNGEGPGDKSGVFARRYAVAGDTTAPELAAFLVSDTGASSTDRLTSDARVTGSVTDASPLASLQAGFDSTPLANYVNVLADRQANGTFAWSAARIDQLAGGTLANGPHVLHLIAADALGNRATLDLSFTLDTLSPTITATLASDTGASSSDRLTADPTVSGSVTDASALATLRAGFDDLPLTNYFNVLPDRQANGGFLFNAARLAQIAGGTLANGPRTLHLVAADAAGNSTARFDVSFTLDTIAPALNAALANDTGTASGDTLTSDPAVSGSLSDAQGIATFRAGLDDLPVDNFVSVLADVSGGQFALSAARLAVINGGPLGQGPHTLHLRATDTAGNESLRDVTFTLDTLAPAPLSVALDPVFDSAPLGDGQTTLSVVTLEGQTEPSATVRLLPSGAVTTADAAGAFSFAGVSLVVGPNVFTVEASDLAGNTSTASTSVTRLGVTPSSLLLSAQLAHDTGSSDTDSITSDTTLVGTVASAQPISVFEISIDHLPSASLLFALDADGNFFVDPLFLEAIAGGPLAQGPHTVALVAEDSAGNSATPVQISFTLDALAPGEPVFALSAGSSVVGVNTTTAARVTLQGTTEPNARILIVETGQIVQSSGSGAFQVPGVPVELGDNLLTAQAFDVAGNQSQSQITVTRVEAGDALDPVIRWNDAAINAIVRDGSTPPSASRALAMLGIAVFDAVNATESKAGYFITLIAPDGASVEAAVTGAAQRILSYLYPAQQSIFAALAVDALANLPIDQALADGLGVGESVANAVIAAREHDGWNDFEPFDSTSSLSGVWEPTAPMYLQALQPQWANLTPFAMQAPDQFRPPGPPSLDSAEYAAALNEVASYGRADSSVRTADQTQIARFWADGLGTFTPPGHWNYIAQLAARQEGTSLADNARLFAELNVALGDAAIMAWDAKYHFNLWRPIQAIAEADLDANPQTQVEPQWAPLLVTPNFPEYVSGHSSFSGAAAKVLTSVFGENFTFDVTSSSLPGIIRSFSSFDEAAAEAGQSRIYGGIHYQFSNRDGQAAGRNVADYVLRTFDVLSDTVAPKITLDNLDAEIVAHDITLTGRVTDNLSGVESLEAQFDGGSPFTVPVDPATGGFLIPAGLLADGSDDGQHQFRLSARDVSGNVSPPLVYTFTLDTLAPHLLLTSPLALADVANDGALVGNVQGTGSAITQLTYAFDGGTPQPIGFDPVTGEFAAELATGGLTVGSHQLVVQARDAAGNTATTTLEVRLSHLAPLTITSLTPADNSVDVGVTYRPKVIFSRPILGSLLNSSNLYATDAAGAKLPATIVPSADGSFAWLLFTNPLPGGATITMHVVGNSIIDQQGNRLDAAHSGVPGSTLTYTFTTVSLENMPGTSLSGKVVDPGLDLKPGTFDDVRPGADGQLMTADDLYLNPLAGVKLYILGQESQVVFTDALGQFSFPSVPAGNVKLVVDGRTALNAPASYYFPEMVMDLNIELGHSNTVMRAMQTDPARREAAQEVGVYLPRLKQSILQTASDTEPTLIGVSADATPNLTESQRQQLHMVVQPGTAIGPNGLPVANPQIGISSVPPELVRDMLPPGLLEHSFDITIQAPEVAVFTAPLQITFPNLFHEAPGTKLNFLSFDHTTGRLVIEGTGTVSADGLSVTTDPDTGVLHPGWHALTPTGGNGGPGGGGKGPGGGGSGCNPPDVPEVERPPKLSVQGNGLKDHFYYKDEAEKISFSFGNTAEKVEPSLDPCNPQNLRATPAIVKYKVYGQDEAGEFLTGNALTSGAAELFPKMRWDVEIQLKPLLDRIKEFNKDRLFAVKIEFEYFKRDLDGNEVKINREDNGKQKEDMVICRLLDAADDKHDDGILEMPRTAPGATHVRELESSASDVISKLTVGNSQDFFANQVLGFGFRPSGEGEDQTTSVQIKAGSPERSIGDLKIKGDSRVDKYFIDGNRLDQALEELKSSDAWSPELQADLADPVKRAALVADAISGVSTRLQAYSPAIRSVGSADDEAIRVNRFTPEQWFPHSIDPDDYGIADLVDEKGGSGGEHVVTLMGRRAEMNEGEFAFRLSKSLNQVKGGDINIYLKMFRKEYSTHERHAAYTDAAQLAKVLTDVMVHEIAHELGMTHFSSDAEIMQGGYGQSDRDRNKTFTVSDPAMRIALGMDWSIEDANAAVDNYLSQSQHSIPTLAESLDTTEDAGIPGPLGWVVEANTGLRPTPLDFGNVMVDGAGGVSVTRNLTLLSLGNEPLVISEVRVVNAPSVTVTQVPFGTTIASHGALPLVIQFDPTSPGLLAGSLVVTSNSPGHEEVIPLAGFAQSAFGDLAVEIANSNLGGRQLGAGPVTGTGIVEVRNLGAAPLTVSNIAIAGGNGQFSVGGLPAGFGPGNPLVLAPGASLQFDASFNPTALNLQRAQIVISSDDPLKPVVSQTLFATGLQPGLPKAGLDYGSDYVALTTPALAGSPVLRQISPPNGAWQFFMPPQTMFQFVAFDPVSGLVSHGSGVTLPSGQNTDTTPLVWGASTAPDSDGDGLADDIEFAVGSNANKADTNGDGIDDFTALAAGFSPLGNAFQPFGMLGGIALDGGAFEVTVAQAADPAAPRLAFVATGYRGLAIVDVTKPEQPILRSQLPMGGDFINDVVYDPIRNRVYAGSADRLYTVDVSDPLKPLLLGSLLVRSSIIELDGDAVYATGGGSTTNALLSRIDLITNTVTQTIDLNNPGGGSQRFPLGLARQGSTLLVITRNDTKLRAFDISGPTMTPRGTLVLPGAGRLTSDGNVLYVASTARADFQTGLGGYSTVDISNPDNLQLISGPNTSNSGTLPDAGVVSNGAGLVLLAGNVFAFDRGVGVNLPGFYLMNGTNPANPTNVITTIPVPFAPSDVKIFGGLAFLPTPGRGLYIANFLPNPDVQAQAPSAAISASVADIDAGAPGLQLFEGTTIRVSATASDDVQIAYVDLLVNGVAAERDLTAPFQNFQIEAPTVGPLGGSLTLQARVVDTAGNSTLSQPLTYQIKPVAPRVAAVFPLAGQVTKQLVSTLTIGFSEAMSQSLAAGTGISLVGAGPDLAFNTLDDVPVPLGFLQWNAAGDQVDVHLAQPLAAGSYRLTLLSAGVQDLQGNLLDGEAHAALPSGDGLAGGDFIATFQILPPPQARFDLFPGRRVNFHPIAPDAQDAATAGSRPGLADINGDGLNDLVEAVLLGTNNGFGVDTASGTLSIALANPAGGFNPPVETPITRQASSVSIGDFNGDGLADAVVYNAPLFDFNTNTQFPASFTVLAGNGLGGFTKIGNELPLPSPLVAENFVTLIDANEDHLADLVIQGPDDTFAAQVLVLPSLGNGTFGAPIVNAVGANLGGSLLKALDLNGDHHLDLVASARIMLGDGEGHFATTQTFSFGPFIGVGDFTGDGDADVLTTSGTAYQIGRGNHDGTFTYQAPVSVAGLNGITGSSSLVADVNQDNRPDWIVMAGTASGANYAVFLGDGQGGFAAPLLTTVLNPANLFLATDVDLDGKPDLIADGNLSFSGPTVSVFTGLGDGTFRVPLYEPAVHALSFTPAKLADINADGKLDALGQYNSNQLAVALGLGNGHFDVPHSLGIVGSSPVIDQVVDLDHDGKLDIILAAGGGIQVLFGTGIGTFAAPQVIGSSGLGFTMLDLNGDTFLDIVFTTTSLGVRLNNGNGTFAATIVPQGQLGDTTRPVVLGDTNHDGKIDAILVSNLAAQVFLGDGTGHFTLSSTLSGTFGATYVAQIRGGDFNNDGNLDVVAVARSGDAKVYLSNGDGTLRQGQSLSGISSISPLLTGDFNEDGLIDILFGGTDGLGVYLGNGDGTFLDDPLLFTGSRSYLFDVGDLDGDGLLDILAPNAVLLRRRN